MNRGEYDLNLGYRVISLILTAALLVSMLTLTGCKKNDEEKMADYPVFVCDVKFVGSPKNVVCFSSTLIGIIFAMGYQSQLTGRTANCEYSQAEEIKAYGTADKPSIDLIKGNTVDLVISDHMEQKDIDEIQELGVPVIILSPATGRASLVEMYCALGTIFRGGNTGYNAGRSVANQILKQLDDIERMVSVEEVWNTCVIMSSSIDEFATGDTIISAILESAGGFNVAKDSYKGEYSLQDMMQSDPEVIICPAGVENMLRAKSNLVGVPALDNFRVYSMDMAVFDDQYQGIIKGAWRMAKLLHPDIITDDVIPEGMIDKQYEDDVFED